MTYRIEDSSSNLARKVRQRRGLGKRSKEWTGELQHSGGYAHNDQYVNRLNARGQWSKLRKQLKNTGTLPYLKVCFTLNSSRQPAIFQSLSSKTTDFCCCCCCYFSGECLWREVRIVLWSYSWMKQELSLFCRGHVFMYFW